MRFDDRLLTVLNQPAGDRHDAAVRWRQLVDLVARAGPNADSPTVAQALETIRADAPRVDESLRAAAARSAAAVPLPLSLVEYFASDRLAVSAPVLAAATLDAVQWKAIMRVADAETRQFIEALHPEIGREPTADLTESLVESDAEEPAAANSAPSLHDVVQRIERRRRSRSTMKRDGAAASTESSPALFRWECGPGGEIAWVDGAPRAALIGRSIARAQEGEQVDRNVVRAFTHRAPFRDAALVLAGDGPMSGAWKISGVPAFEPSDGRFAGYRGIALREQRTLPADRPAGLLADPDSLRELVHEVKTPLNAIMGFAEIIEGQYLGPAEQSYRERAQEIVAQARLLLTAVDDLDFAARVHSSVRGEQRSVNLGELVERMTAGLRELASARGVEVDTSRTTRDTSAAIEPALAERLIERMCSALIEQAESGERLRLTVERAGERSRVSVTRPAKLADFSADELLGGGADPGISLRLVRGLARLAGAELVAPHGSISLLFARV